jgi:hypothetical protein
MRRVTLFCGLALGLLAGCVERRMTIVSDPPGAAVIVNGKDIGAAPADVPSKMFVYYGDYNITLLRDGYEPLLIRQPVPKPWYECFPLDFVSENLVPWHIQDKRLFSYQLLPPAVVPPENLLDRASNQRQRARTIVPMPPMAEIGAPGQPPLEELPPPARLQPPMPEQP